MWELRKVNIEGEKNVYCNFLILKDNEYVCAISPRNEHLARFIVDACNAREAK